jgi:anti-sigma regulatory factor (Ser/Thr protein kinase)
MTGWEGPWPTRPCDCQHDALVYDSPDHLAAMAAPFLLEGLAAGEAAVLATGTATATALREAVAGDPRVSVVDRDDVYGARPATAITTLRRLADQFAADGVARVRIVGEIDYGPDERNWLEWQRYEAVITATMTGRPLWGLCLFDTQRVPEPLVEAALRTHPMRVTAAGREISPEFVEPDRFLRSLEVPDEPLERTSPRLEADDVVDFVVLRRAVAAELATVDAPADLLDDFLLAVDEMTSNALRHGRPPIGLRLWRSDDRLVCTVSDRGPGFDDPFAGYGPAHGEDLSRGGMGLWLARQLCDHVDVSRDAGGLRVRLTVRLD